MGLADALKERFTPYYADPSASWNRPASNGNGKHAPASETKGIPTGTFFSPDSLRTIHYLGGTNSETDHVTRQTAYAAAIYAYAAMTWRAEKYSEPPLFVGELSDDDEVEWLPDHDLASLLDHPHPDLDMGELLFQTRLYRDATGSALWVKDLDRGGRVARLTPFSGDEFEVKRADGRIFGAFQVRTAGGGREALPAERCVYFREPGPSAWGRGVAPLDVALQALNMGKQATATVKSILKNALFPSVVIQADKEWSPTEEEMEQWRAALDRYAETEHKGKPLALTGGGSASVVSMSLKDLIPDKILDRVEANVAAAFRVPPIVLQFKVGLENSPWSQMGEARRGVTQDLLVPMWTRDGKKLTAQLLRAPADRGRQPLDDNPMRYVQFALQDVAALQPDRARQAETAKNKIGYARIKDLRSMVDDEPLDDSDPRNDLILLPNGNLLTPEGLLLTATAPVAVQPSAGSVDEGGKAAGGDLKALTSEAKRDLSWVRFDAQTKAQEPTWRREAAKQLEDDRKTIAALAERHLREAKEAEDGSVQRFIEAVAGYLEGDAKAQWLARMAPLIEGTGEAALKDVATELGIGFDVLQPGLVSYTEQHAAQLVTQVTDTTRKAVADAVAAGIDAGDSVRDIAKRIRESDAAFGKARSELIARTETTQVTNQVQRSSLSDFARTEGVTVQKSWLTARDGRVRDEHAALDGEKAGIDEAFSDGQTEPGEPNCRCTLLYEIEED